MKQPIPRQPVQITSENSTLLESLIKRPAPQYTLVPIGINPVNQIKYQFKPIVDGDDSSPHVCRVLNQHVPQFMRAEGFAIYGTSVEEEVEDPNFTEHDNEYWLDLDAAGATAKELELFCTDVIGIVATDREALNRVLTDFSLDIQRAQPFTSVHRRLLVAWQKAERRAILAATGYGAVDVSTVISGAGVISGSPTSNPVTEPKKKATPRTKQAAGQAPAPTPPAAPEQPKNPINDGANIPDDLSGGAPAPSGAGDDQPPAPPASE